MVLPDIGGNLTEAISLLPPPMVESIGTLVTVLKAVGIAFIIYVIYSISMAVLNWKRFKLLKEMDRRMSIIERKLDSVLKKPRRK